MHKNHSYIGLNKFYWVLYKLLIFILFSFSMYPWFTWSGELISFGVIIIGSLGSVLFYILNPNVFAFNNKFNIGISFLLLVSFLLYIKAFTIIGAVQQIFVFINILFVLNLSNDLKVEIFEFITKYFAIFLLISLVYYLIFLLGFDLPHHVINDSTLGYTGKNYFLFLEENNFVAVNRFRSIFAEPGHLTMGIIPLLYGNKFNLKNKYVVILLIAELLTLSLAGFLTVFVSILIFSFSNQSNKVACRLLLIFLMSTISICYAVLSEQNELYVAIFSRLLFDEDKGSIAGNNRTDKFTDDYFNRYIFTLDAVFGLGNEQTILITSDSGAGYKVFLLRFGIICFILILSFFLLIAAKNFSYDVIGFFIILLLLLAQNTYPFWFCISFSYITGIHKLAVLNYKKIKTTNL